MAMDAESGQALIEMRAEVLVDVMIKACPKSQRETIVTFSHRISKWVEDNLQALLKSEPWLNGKSLDFLHSPGWLKRHSLTVQQVAATNGYAYSVAPFQGAILTKGLTAIRQDQEAKQKALERQVENLNALREKYNKNDYYSFRSLQFPLFNIGLLPPPQK